MRLFTILSNIRDIKTGKKEINPKSGICKNIGIRDIPIKLLKSWDNTLGITSIQYLLLKNMSWQKRSIPKKL